jgi:RsiW-degrading membrane proteinase PrsW (M82 family)
VTQLVTFLLVVLSVFAATLPMLSFLALIWWLDRYDREPVWMVALTFAWGALGGAGLSLFGNTLVHFGISLLFGAEHAAWAGPVVVAPLIEEPTKAVILLLVATSRYFDNTTDGFVYGAAAGLGFGMTENMLYFYQSSQLAGFDLSHGVQSWALTVTVRTFYSAVMHATATAIIGASIGWSRFRPLWAKLTAIPVGLSIAFGIHALWNGMLTLNIGGLDEETRFIANLVIFPLEVLLTFSVFQLSLYAEKRTLLRELAEEARLGVLPAAHVAPLSSYIGRLQTTFHPSRSAQDAYIRAATALAFRKHQARSCSKSRKAEYRNDIDRLRRELQGLLSED